MEMEMEQQGKNEPTEWIERRWTVHIAKICYVCDDDDAN